MVSTTSAWCSASRAAQLIASEGVGQGDRVEVARAGRVGAEARLGQHSVSTRRPITPVKLMNSSASSDVEGEVEPDHLLAARRRR